MNHRDHLMLRMARLKAAEEMDQVGEGLNFLFAKGGVGRYASRLGTHRIGLGDFLVFNATQSSKLSVFDSKGDFLFWTFSISFEHLLPLFAHNEISLLRNVINGFEAGKVYPATNPLSGECLRLLALVPSQFNLDHRGQLIRIAATILSKEFKDGLSKRTAGGGSRSEDHMIQVFEKLSASEMINLSVGELADRFNCSRRHLNRLFHQHFGASVAALRMEMRLLKAVSLLRDPSIKVIHVAEQCGFNHLGLFNTCFKRRFGTSPGQWRKSSVQSTSVASDKLMIGTGSPSQNPGPHPTSNKGALEAMIPPAMVAGCVEKVKDGKDVLDDLKRREVLFGPQFLAGSKEQSPEADTEE